MKDNPFIPRAYLAEHASVVNGQVTSNMVPVFNYRCRYTRFAAAKGRTIDGLGLQVPAVVHARHAAEGGFEAIGRDKRRGISG